MKLPMSERMRNALKEVLEGDYQGEFLVSDFIKRAVGLVAQEFLESEVGEHLQRGRYERNQGSTRGQRNGYKPLTFKTGEGQIEVQKPQIRGGESPYQSK